MPESRLVAFLFDAWDDLDRAFEGLTAAEATARVDGGSSYGWTLQHVALGVDNFVNAMVRGQSRHPVLEAEYAAHGRSGDCGDWDAVWGAAADVRAELEAYLSPLTDADLESLMAPATERFPSVPLRYLVGRSVAHIYVHVGEVAAKRGQDVYPGPLEGWLG